MSVGLESMVEISSAQRQYHAKFDSISPAEWTAEISKFSDASVYQTWQYGEISWGKSNLSHFVLEHDGKTAAMAQLRIIKTPILPAGIAYVRWAPLFRSREDDWNVEVFREALRALREEYAQRRRLLLRVIPNIYETDPASGAIKQILRDLQFEVAGHVRPYNSIRVDLSASVEQLRKGLRQRWRNKLKHAEAEGFTVTIGTTDAMYARFHRAYDEMMARKRFDTTVSVDEFARLQCSLPDRLKMRVLLCEKVGVLFNTLVVAPAGDTGIYLLAATSNAGLQADGAFLLQWQAMQMLKAEGFQWYDLGGINPETNPGVYQFKSGMGGSEMAQLGLFEYCSNPLSKLTVRGAERAVRARSRIGRLFRNAQSLRSPAAVDNMAPAARQTANTQKEK